MKSNQMVRGLLNRAVFAALVGSVAVPAMAGGFGIDIHIDAPRPRPPVVVVEEREPVVYETFVVGYRRNLYDADLRVRLARADEWQAHEELDAARHNEGELAVALDEKEALVEELRHRRGNPERIAEIHARLGETAELTADLRRRLNAYEWRISANRELMDASQILRDRNGMADAEDRIRSNEARAASTAAELREAQDRLARLEREEADAKAMAVDSDRLHDAEDRAADVRHKLELAHDAVYATQKRLTAAQDEVYAALHDRDEALWLLHRDEILAGRFEPEKCGFVIDLSVWGGRMPRDPEVIHAYCVHDAGYWRANPVHVEERVVIVDRVTEVTKVREIQRVREVDRVQRVERVEKVVKVEDRRRVAEVAVVERKRYEAETVERKTAVAEHRAPKAVYVEKPAASKERAPKEESRSSTSGKGANTRADVARASLEEEKGKTRSSDRTASTDAKRPSVAASEPDPSSKSRRRGDAPVDPKNPKDPKNPQSQTNARD